MGKFHDNRFPGETTDYRKARDELLELEIDLRRRQEAIAHQRRALPLGGELKQDYVFEEGTNQWSDRESVNPVHFSRLFDAGKDSLVVYSFMYGPDAGQACPMCTSLLDSLDGNAAHIQQQVNLVVVAKAPIQKIRDWARDRGWNNLRLLSSFNNTYNRDYFAETQDGEQLPFVNVFQKTPDGIFHFYNSELFFVPPEQGQDPRHVDGIWSLWNVLDLTPHGRGAGWYPKNNYEE